MIRFESMPFTDGSEIVIGRSDNVLGQNGVNQIALDTNRATGKTVIVSDGDSTVGMAQNGALLEAEV